jgi:hypothetical protein
MRFIAARESISARLAARWITKTIQNLLAWLPAFFSTSDKNSPVIINSGWLMRRQPEVYFTEAWG